MAVAHQLVDAGRGDRDSVLVVLDLAGDADLHRRCTSFTEERRGAPWPHGTRPEMDGHAESSPTDGFRRKPRAQPREPSLRRACAGEIRAGSGCGPLSTTGDASSIVPRARLPSVRTHPCIAGLATALSRRAPG